MGGWLWKRPPTSAPAHGFSLHLGGVQVYITGDAVGRKADAAYFGQGDSIEWLKPVIKIRRRSRWGKEKLSGFDRSISEPGTMADDSCRLGGEQIIPDGSSPFRPGWRLLPHVALAAVIDEGILVRSTLYIGKTSMG